MALTFALLLGLGCAGPERSPARRPTKLLLITVDTLRGDHLGKTVAGLPVTPNLDQLMERGTVFTHTLAPVPRTTQSLASLLTGAYPHTTGVRTLYHRLRPKMVTLAELLVAHGWTTWAVVSNHVLTPDRGLHRGFQIYDHAHDTRDAAATNQAVLDRFTAAGGSPDPFFLWVHYIDPHAPYMPPEATVRAFDPGYDGPYSLGFGTEPGGIGDLAYPPDLPKWQAVYQNRLPARVNEHVRRLYAADIHTTDRHIGELLEALGAGDANSDWLVAFAADHGEALGEHGLFFDHGDHADTAGLRVPMALIPPAGDQRERGRVVSDWVSIVDLLPTLVEELSLYQPPALVTQIEGRSLTPYLEGREMPPKAVYGETGRSFFPRLVRRRVRFDVAGRPRTVVLGQYKLVWTPGRPAGSDLELFDLDTDPGELEDVSADHPQRTQRLSRLLDLWLQPTAEQDSGPSKEDLERLRSLGYVGP